MEVDNEPQTLVDKFFFWTGFFSAMFFTALIFWGISKLDVTYWQCVGFAMMWYVFKEVVGYLAERNKNKPE